MKKLFLACLFILGCGPSVGPPPFLLATATLTDYQYIGGGIYYYYNDCGPIYYYGDGTYNATCTYAIDNIMTAEVIRIGDTLACPGPSYRKIEYVNGNLDSMDYTVDCE